MENTIDKFKLTSMNNAIMEIVVSGSATDSKVDFSILPEESMPTETMSNIIVSDTEKADITNGIISHIQDSDHELLDDKFILRFSLQKFSGISQDSMKERFLALNSYLKYVYGCYFSGEDIDGNPIDISTALRMDFMRLKKQAGRAYLEESNLEERASRDKKIYAIVTKYINEMLFYISDPEMQGVVLKAIKSCEKGVHISVKSDEFSRLNDDEKSSLQKVFDKLYGFEIGDIQEDEVIIMPGEESLAYSLTRDVVSRWMLF